MTSVSIIICTWNRAEMLCESLVSLSAQRYDPSIEIEVIVVDNNSSDTTADSVKLLQKDWPLGSLKYRFERRQGKQFALNTGISNSCGEILAFTDDDIVFPPNWIANIVSAFDHADVELVGGKTLITWDKDGPPVWYAAEMSAILGGVDIGDTRMCPPPPGYAPAGGNMMARRRLFDRVGMFSEAHFRHMDYEFGLRCAAYSTVIAYEPNVLVCAPVDPHMLTRRYFCRWAFKAGILHEIDSATEGANLLGVPRWVYRRLLQDILRWPFDRLSASAALAFSRELRIYRASGIIASRWHEHLWPRGHAEWVARYAQKKKNVY